MIGQLAPPLDAVSVLVLNVTDDVALLIWHLEYCAQPVCLVPLAGRRAPRPGPKVIDVGAIGRVEGVAVKGVEVEPNGVRNRYECPEMGKVVDLDPDLYLRGKSEPVLLSGEKEGERANSSHVDQSSCQDHRADCIG